MGGEMNNKGFSLVELIVVIAIMAVLVGILTPVLLGNIEKSKLSKDKESMDTLYSAMLNAAADEQIAIDANTCSDITYNAATGVVSFQTDTDFWKEVQKYLSNKTSIQLESRYYKGNTNAQIQFSMDAHTRVVSISCDDDGNSATNKDHAQFALGE